MKGKSELLFRLKNSKFFVAGFVLSSLILILSLISPYIIVFDTERTNLNESLNPPQFFSKGWSGHVLGTDYLGRDVLSRLLIGGKFSLQISLTAVFWTALIGIITGLYSGYYGGVIDNLIMRFADIQLSIPPLLLAIAIVAVLGPNVTNLIIVLVITSWPYFARLVRGNVLVVREMDFVKSSIVLGANDSWIIFTQILPNITTPIIIVSSQRVGYMILMEAYLSFLGLGVQPPTPSWGVMISDGRHFISVAPWIILAPGIVLMMTVMSYNFIGDGLRDILDPKMKT